MRVLITAAPFHGHVNAVLPLARAARRAGHEVVVATGADLVEHPLRFGLAAWPVGPTRARSGTPRSLDEFGHTAHERAADLLPRAEQWRPDLVVAEEMELGGAVVAARTGAPLVVHGLGIAATRSPAALAPALDDLGKHWGVRGLYRLHTIADYVSVCPPSLQPPSSQWRTVLRMRPGLGEPAPGERLPATIDDLPYEDTVHLTLGTVFHARRPGAMADAITGLRDLPANLVVTLGPGVSPAEFGRQPAHVRILGYLPHALLLPRVRLVVSHGGAGIVLGALAHGLPQLVMPQGADQLGNGAAVARAGAGLMLRGVPTPAEVADTARLLLEDPSYASAAGRISREIAAMPTAQDVVEELFSAGGRGARAAG